MPIIKSAKKRVQQARKSTIRNARTKRNLREAIKAFVNKPSTDSHNVAQSNLDKAAKKGIVHKNKVARKKRQLAAAAKAAGVKPVAAAKKSTAKPAAKKTAPAKPVAKKAAPAKKAAAKPAASAKK